MGPKFSVIVPVYNTPKEYLIECLESIRHQTYTDYEAIIVNDGSTDECEGVIKEYISDFALGSFKLVSKPNGGLCSARNEGLKHATGEWVAFVDSDDWLEPSYLENFAKADEKYKADYYITGFRAYEIETGKFDTWSNYNVEYGEMPEDLKNIKSLDYVWARIYKKAIIDEYSLAFDERIRFCEDNAFNFDYAGVIKSFGCIKEIGYTYRRGHSGAMSKMSVTPYMRKSISEHLYGFYSKIPHECIVEALRENKSFARIVWNTQLTEIVVCILEKNDKAAKLKMKSPLAQALIKEFTPSTKKDKLFHALWNKSFFAFKLFVNVFYKNIDKIKKVKWLSHFLTH